LQIADDDGHRASWSLAKSAASVPSLPTESALTERNACQNGVPSFEDPKVVLQCPFVMKLAWLL
jgi:hypothetical protein